MRRTSTMPSAPKPPTTLSSSTVIADNASLSGTHTIKIGSNTAIHPRTKLFSGNAPITIGNYCILSERSITGYQSAIPDAEKERGGGGVVIGNGVVIEVGAVVEAKEVGDGCVIEVNARIGKGAVLGEHCRVSPLCIVAPEEVVPAYTVIYGDGLRRLDRSGVKGDVKIDMIGRQADVLRRLILSNPAKFQS
ncbi:trimeric LpxA-like protein [Calycina marina]|uniref:Dynactin subunit 6 n=1 Tax=Calycina marina TaxID=1763456 RepID=A0A9P7ZB35_9HELO|nr:trimeric LpxA-like protein [Calycina marina]